MYVQIVLGSVGSPQVSSELNVLVPASPGEEVGGKGGKRADGCWQVHRKKMSIHVLVTFAQQHRTGEEFV